MSQLSWKEQRKRIIDLIQEVSDLWGGDDEEWLFEYTKDILEKYNTLAEMDVAIKCFEDLRNQALAIGKGKGKESHGKGLPPRG